MALDLSASNLRDEVRAAVENRELFLKTWKDDLEAYAGPGFKSADRVRNGSDPENHAFEVCSLFVPMLASGTPRTKVKSARQGQAQAMAKAVQLAKNRLARDTEAKKLNELLAYDYLIRWAATITARTPRPGVDVGHGDPKTWPVTSRISPPRFLSDPLALQPDLWRYTGHTFTNDLDDLLELGRKHSDQGWNLKVIRNLAPNTRADYLTESTKRERHTPDRREVDLHEIWIPEAKIDKDKKAKDGWNGAVYTVALGQSASGAAMDFVRAPRDYWGPPEGPYSYGRAYVVPDEPMGLSPIVATMEQAAALNRHTRSMIDAMDAYKKIIAVAGESPDLAEKITQGEDLWVYVFENLDEVRSQVAQLELGGVTEQHIATRTILKEILDRAAGMSEAMRGNVDGKATAFENQVAATAGSRRTGWIAEGFLDMQADIAKKECWFLVRDDKVELPLGDEAAGVFVNEFGQPIEQPVFQGGLKDEEMEDWDSLGFEIEPFSISRTDEHARANRQIMKTQYLQQTLPMMLQFPFVDWERVVSEDSDTMEIEDQSDYIDFEAAQEIGMTLLQAQIETKPGAQQKPQERLVRDLGGGGRQAPFGDQGSSGDPSKELAQGRGGTTGVAEIGGSE